MFDGYKIKCFKHDIDSVCCYIVVTLWGGTGVGTVVGAGVTAEVQAWVETETRVEAG